MDPFKPSPGVTPPALVGRDEILNDLKDGLEGSPGNGQRLSLLTGPRGCGKTVMLNALEEMARQQGWHVYQQTALAGFTDKLTLAILRTCHEEGKTRGRVDHVQVGSRFLGLDWKPPSAMELPVDFLQAMKQLLDLKGELDRNVNQFPTGVLITLDELHKKSREELNRFAADIQHLMRQDANIAVAMAGIPSSVAPLLSDKAGDNPITFLRRADKHVLGAIEESEVRRGLRDPVNELGIAWEEDALAHAVDACGGYAYMIQLVGSWCFKCARGSEVIDIAAAREGVCKAKSRIGRLVHSTALEDLSDMDRSFLLAMSKDQGESTMKDIRGRLDISPQQANLYKIRLLEAGMIEQTGYGRVSFTLPFLADYLRKHAASLAIKSNAAL